MHEGVLAGRGGRGRLLAVFWIVLAVLAPALLATASRAAETPAPAAPTDLAGLVSTYGVGDVPADLVVVADTSGSMSTEGNPPPWPSVQGAWAALAASAGPNDRVGLITFSDAATNRWNLKAVTTPEERAQLVAALPNQTGGGTNIGAALNSAVQMLSQGGSSEIQRVVFITDGINEPGADTQFPADTSQGEWPQLIEEGKQLVASRDGQLSAFGWAPPGSGPTDVALVQKVFPNAEVLALPNDQFQGFLGGLASDVERARVRPAITKDLATPITGELKVDPKLTADMPARLTFTNPRKGLPTQVDFKGVTVSEASGAPVPATAAPTTFTLAPGQSQALDVTLHPAGTDHGWPSLGQHDDLRSWKVQVQASTALSEQLTGLLQHEQLADPQQTVGTVVTSPETVQVAGAFGFAWWKLALLIITVLVVAYVIWRFAKWLFIPPPLSGAILAQDGTLLLKLRGREQALPQASVPAGDTEDEVRLFTKARSHAVRVEKVAGDPQLRDEPMMGRSTKLIGGDLITLGRVTVEFQRSEPTKKRKGH